MPRARRTIGEDVESEGESVLGAVLTLDRLRSSRYRRGRNLFISLQRPLDPDRVSRRRYPL